MELLKEIYENYTYFLSADSFFIARFCISMFSLYCFNRQFGDRNFNDYKDIPFLIFNLVIAVILTIIPVIYLILPILLAFYGCYLLILKFCQLKNSLKLKLTILVLLLFSLAVYCTTHPFQTPKFDETQETFHEKDYVQAYCKGVIEYVLPDRTRVDCLTDEYAIEFDWGKKWAEAIGQSLYYAKMTGKKPGVAIIIKSPKEQRYIERIKKVDKNIEIFVIKARDFSE